MSKQTVSPLHQAVEFARRNLNAGEAYDPVAGRRAGQSASHSFEAERWQEAVQYHHYRFWEGNILCPYIDLGGVTLVFDPVKDEYAAHGIPMFVEAPSPDNGSKPLVVDHPSGAAVRDALMRFVKNKTCLALTFYFHRGTARVELWKTPVKGLLGVAAAGIPAQRIIAPAPVHAPAPVIVQERQYTPINAVVENIAAQRRRPSSSQQLPSA